MERTGAPRGLTTRATDFARSGWKRVKSWGHHAAGVWHASPVVVKRPVEVTVRTFRLYGQDNGSMYAAAIAYYALFSLVPLALITISIFGFVTSPDRMVDWVFEQFPLEETQDVRDDVHSILSFSRTLGGAGLGIGVVTLLWSASGLFGAVRRGLNVTQNVSNRPFWHAKLVDFSMVLATGLLVTTSLALTTITRVTIERAGDLGFVEIGVPLALKVSLYLGSGVFSLVLFTFLYRFVPSERPSWKQAAAGGLVAAVLFELLKNLGAFLVENAAFSQNASIYSGVSLVFGFLFWVYLSASILLIGSEFIRAIWGKAPDAVEAQFPPVT